MYQKNVKTFKKKKPYFIQVKLQTPLTLEVNYSATAPLLPSEIPLPAPKIKISHCDQQGHLYWCHDMNRMKMTIRAKHNVALR